MAQKYERKEICVAEKKTLKTNLLERWQSTYSISEYTLQCDTSNFGARPTSDAQSTNRYETNDQKKNWTTD